MKATPVPLLLLLVLLTAGCRNIVIEGQFFQPSEATAMALALPAATASTPDLNVTAAIERAVRLTLTAAPSPTQTPPPFLRAFPEGDFVDGSYWPAGQPVYLEINDLVFITTAGSDGRVEFVLAGHDLKQEDVLTMRSGDFAVAHPVKQLFVTAIDLDAQTIAGTVDGQEVVHLWAGGADLKVDSDERGNWLADFSGLGDPVLFPGACGGVEAWGEGRSSTIVDWCVPPPPPSPWLTAFPERDFVESFEWPMGAFLHLTIDDPNTEVSLDLESDDTAEPSPWGDPRTYVSFDFAGAYDLKPGDMATLSDGVTERTLVVQNLSITAVDAVADTVAGTADPGAVVNVWPHETGEQVAVTTDPSGFWQVDLTGAYDIVPGSGGRAEIRDDLYNGTAVDWGVPWPILREGAAPTTTILPTQTPLPTATPKPAPGAGLSTITNLALNQSATASNSLQSPANMAVDGNTSTGWGAGAGAPQWIEIDLGAPATITRIRLLVTQHPYGDTLHRILVRSVNSDFSEVVRFEQYTNTGQWLVFTPEEPLPDVQIVRIETLNSPSWVGWLEIQVLGER